MIVYFRNEHEVGSALKKSGIPREDIYVTTKVRGMHAVCYDLIAIPHTYKHNCTETLASYPCSHPSFFSLAGRKSVFTVSEKSWDGWVRGY